MSEKMRYFGYILLLSGTVLFGIMHLAIALYIPSLIGWGSPPGKLGTVLIEISGWVPYILSIIFMVVGMSISIYGMMNKSLQKQLEEMKNRDRQWVQEIRNKTREEG